MVQKIQENQQGVILVSTLIIMSVLLSIAVSFGYLVASDIRKAYQLENSLLAYYGAETGMEKSLYLFRKNDNVKWKDDVIAIIGSEGALENGTIWDISESDDYESDFFRQRLYNGQSAKLYFLKRTDFDLGDPQLPKSIRVRWLADNPAIKMQISFTQLTAQTEESGSVIYYTDLSEVKSFPNDPGNPDDYYCFEFPDKKIIYAGNPEPPYDYLVEIRALGSPYPDTEEYIESLNVLAYNTDCLTQSPSNPQAITNITLRSVGEKSGSRQEIVAHWSPRKDVSDLFGFVLFSERGITKSY